MKRFLSIVQLLNLKIVHLDAHYLLPLGMLFRTSFTRV